MRLVMKFAVPVFALLALAAQGCAVAKEARLSLENAVDPPFVQEFSWGRVECGEGQVCQEVVVERVDVHGDPVEITLQNRTLEAVAVQVQLETFKNGVRTDRTGYHDVALAPREESVLTLWQQLEEGEQLVVKLRARS
jgi:hypothetical protein